MLIWLLCEFEYYVYLCIVPLSIGGGITGALSIGGDATGPLSIGGGPSFFFLFPRRSCDLKLEPNDPYISCCVHKGPEWDYLAIKIARNV